MVTQFSILMQFSYHNICFEFVKTQQILLNFIIVLKGYSFPYNPFQIYVSNPYFTQVLNFKFKKNIHFLSFYFFHFSHHLLLK